MEIMDWVTCCAICVVFVVDDTIRALSEKIRHSFSSFSPLRKALTGLFFILIPICIQFAVSEESANPLSPKQPVLWFIASSVLAVLAFWLWEEIVETKPVHRIAFLVIVGCVMIILFDYEVFWSMNAARNMALSQEAKSAHDAFYDVLQRKLLIAVLPQQQSITVAVKPARSRPQITKPLIPLSVHPSFPYMSPGLWVNGNTWDFIVNHRGDSPSYNVEMLFQDDVKRQQVLNVKTSITPEDINSYQRLLRFPEVDPKGHGSIFAKQFLWTPPVAEHEKYTVDITWRDGRAHEELNIEKVGDKWFYSMRIEEADTHVILISCMDAGFPGEGTGLEPCFPKYSLP